MRGKAERARERGLLKHARGWGWSKREAETGSEMGKGPAESLLSSQMGKQMLGDCLLPLQGFCGCSLAGGCLAAASLTDGVGQSLIFERWGFFACSWSAESHTAETLHTP